jgi:hypothetical protein
VMLWYKVKQQSQKTTRNQSLCPTMPPEYMQMTNTTVSVWAILKDKFHGGST